MFALLLTFILSVFAQELMVSSIDPCTLLLEETQPEEDVALIDDMLKRYAKASRSVLVGEIMTMRNVESNLGKDREAEIIVQQWLRGSGMNSQTIFIPYNAPFITGDWDTVPGKVVRGYPVLIFLDNQGRVLNGNAIFYIDDKYLWRNKRPGLFLNPSYDREWVDQNPYEDYVVIPLTRVSYWLSNQKPAFWVRQ